ncbi:MAG: 3-mercaptopyruvate sulfurtransferase [Gammaproteobacteria bacterium]
MSELQLPDAIVSAEWLHQHIDHPNLVIFDASWHMPAANRDAFSEWQNEQIKNARFFDFDQAISDPDSDLPHMMPDVDLFTIEVQKLGLNHDSQVVVYDSVGMFSSPRVWWMLRAMGFNACAVLDGGLPAWKSAGFEINSHPESVPIEQGNYIADQVDSRFCDSQAVLSAIDDTSTTILDARPAERFRGEVDEPRAGLRRGRMPGACNLPFPDLFAEGLMKPKPELEAIFARMIPPGNRTICSCGSGVTACVIALGAHLVGYDDITVYDGSWCEWGLPGDLPVVGLLLTN